MAEYDADVPAGIVMTSMEAIVGWLRKTSFWPLTMGLACCAIEMISYCLLYTSPSPRDRTRSRMPSSA